MTTKTVNFEKSLEKLETLVTAMESGDLSLEDGLKKFEQGVGLIRQCQTLVTGCGRRR